MMNDRLILTLLGLSMAFVLLAMPINFLMPVLVVDIYNKESEAFGLLMSMMGVGSLIGSLAVASLGHWRRGMIVIGGGFLTGFSLLLIAGLPYYFAGVVIMVVMGLGNAANRAVNQGLVMEHIKDEYRGRVMSVYMMSFGLMPLGVLPMGIGADLLGPRPVIAMMAIAMLLVTAGVLVTQKNLRSIH
jgi:MFS family permease